MPKLSLNPFPLKQPPRNQKKMCQICSNAFGITKRQHLCKRCYRFVCDSCAPYKVKTYRADMQVKMHRLCSLCDTQSQILKKYSQNCKLQWGVDSPLSKIWLRQIENNFESDQQKTKILSKNKLGNRKKAVSYQLTIEELWTSFNYAFRELVGISIDRNSSLQKAYEQQIKKDKQKGLNLLYSKILQQILQILSIIMSGLNNQKIEAQSLIYIIIFFMVHSSPDTTVILTKYILNIVSQKQISIKNILSYLKFLGCNKNQIDRMQNFIQLNSSHIAKLVTINYFSAQISIQIVSSLILRKEFQQLQKVIAFATYKRKQFIIKNQTNSDLIQIDILRNLQGLGDSYKRFLKLCEKQQQSPTRVDKNLEKSQTTSLSSKKVKNKKTYEQLLEQNQQLKIKHKNQQQQIIRLRIQNKKLLQRQKKLFLELETSDKWGALKNKQKLMEQNNKKFHSNHIDDIDASSSQSNDNINGQTKTKRQKLSQCNRSKKMSTMSQKLSKQTQSNDKNEKQKYFQTENFNYQQVIFTKNQQILNLRKQVQHLKKKQTQNPSNILQNAMKQNEKLKKQLQKKQQMNKLLLQKMKQLSNMLMDKQEEQVNLSQQKIEEFYQIQIQSQKKDQQCIIF